MYTSGCSAGPPHIRTSPDRWVIRVLQIEVRWALFPFHHSTSPTFQQTCEAAPLPPSLSRRPSPTPSPRPPSTPPRTPSPSLRLSSPPAPSELSRPPSPLSLLHSLSLVDCLLGTDSRIHSRAHSRPRSSPGLARMQQRWTTCNRSVQASAPRTQGVADPSVVHQRREGCWDRPTRVLLCRRREL